LNITQSQLINDAEAIGKIISQKILPELSVVPLNTPDELPLFLRLPPEYWNNINIINRSTLFETNKLNSSEITWQTESAFIRGANFFNETPGKIIGSKNGVPIDETNMWTNGNTIHFFLEPSQGRKVAWVNDSYISGGRIVANSGDALVINNGTIDAFAQVFEQDNGAITAVNNGTINMKNYERVFLAYTRDGSNTNFLNNGTINLSFESSAAFMSTSPKTTSINNGLILGVDNTTCFQIQPYPWGTDYSANSNSIINTIKGTINLGKNSKAISVTTNSGIAVGGDLTNQNINSKITNEGIITSSGDGSYGVYLNNANHVIIDNTGSINLLGGSDVGIYISPTSSVDSLYNTGSIICGGINSDAIKNEGSLALLINSQGSSGTKSTPLNFNGLLPTQYQILVNSKSSYGQIAFSNLASTSPMAFSIYGGSTDNQGSILDTGTYKGVLSGIDASNLDQNSMAGSCAGLQWKLVADTTDTRKWDLVVTR